MATKTGYVQSYKLELHPSPKTRETVRYFTVVISKDKRGTEESVELALKRNTQSSQVDETDEKLLAISYSNVQQAMIATLKDALALGRVVTVGYVDKVPGVPGRPLNPPWDINSVEIQKP